MSRKDYEAFAVALASVRPEYTDHADKESWAQERQWESCVRAVGDVLAADNSRFDRVRFVQACMKVKP